MQFRSEWMFRGKHHNIYIRPGLSAYSKQTLPDRCCVNNIDNDGTASVCSHRDASMPSEESAYTSAGAPTTSESSSTDVDVSESFIIFLPRAGLINRAFPYGKARMRSKSASTSRKGFDCRGREQRISYATLLQVVVSLGLTSG